MVLRLTIIVIHSPDANLLTLCKFTLQESSHLVVSFFSNPCTQPTHHSCLSPFTEVTKPCSCRHPNGGINGQLVFFVCTTGLPLGPVFQADVLVVYHSHHES
jgi:hypothetical protein